MRFVPDRPEWDCVHFVPPVAPGGVAAPTAAERLRQAGWVLARIDGGAVTGDEALFDALAEALRFPGYFGRNWSALGDCLSDLEWLPAPGYALTVARATTLWAQHPTTAGMLVEVWLHRAERWAGRGVPFHLVFEWDPPDER